MAKAIVYKKAQAWVYEVLSYAPDSKPVDLFRELQATFPEDEVPMGEHAVATWVRKWKKEKEGSQINKLFFKFDPIDTFNDSDFRDIFSTDDKEFLLKFSHDLHICYTQPMGLRQEITNGVAIWVTKIKNAMPILADRPLDLYLFALGLLNVETRPDSEADVEAFKKYLYAKPFFSQDTFIQWVNMNTEDQSSMPVDVFKHLDIEDLRPKGKWTEENLRKDNIFWLKLPEIIACNIALMPQHMPHLKMLNFVYWSLQKYLEQENNIIVKLGDKDLFAELENAMASVGRYFDQIDISNNKNIKTETLDLFVKIEDKYGTDVFLPEKFPSHAFNWYWALLINCFNLARSGGRTQNNLAIVPNSQLLKFEYFFPKELRNFNSSPKGYMVDDEQGTITLLEDYIRKNKPKGK